jgi:hypothetical protein
VQTRCNIYATDGCCYRWLDAADAGSKPEQRLSFAECPRLSRALQRTPVKVQLLTCCVGSHVRIAQLACARCTCLTSVVDTQAAAGLIRDMTASRSRHASFRRSIRTGQWNGWPECSGRCVSAAATADGTCTEELPSQIRPRPLSVRRHVGVSTGRLVRQLLLHTCGLSLHKLHTLFSLLRAPNRVPTWRAALAAAMPRLHSAAVQAL